MFSLSKGEPPTPPNTTTTSTTGHCDVPRLPMTDTSLRSQSISEESTGCSPSEQQQQQMGTLELTSIPRPPEPDSGFEASPPCLSKSGGSRFPYDEQFCDEEICDDVFESEDEACAQDILLEGGETDDRCPDCHDISCSCSRAESSATVRAGATDPNTCSDSSRSSSPQPSSWSIPVPCSHIHNDRLPCPRCSGDDTLQSSTVQTSRSYPGSYPAALLNWWTRRTGGPRVAVAPSRTSNRSDDRRTTRSRRRQIDSDAPSSSSEENSADELFCTACEDDSYLDGTMTEADELRVTSPEQLPDLVPLSSDSSSRRLRSQSVSIPVDHEYLREVGISLRRLSNEFENNRYAERNGQSRRSSLTSFLNWRS